MTARQDDARRSFLKTFVLAVGTAGTGVLIESASGAHAAFDPAGAPLDTVNTNLTVHGNLLISSGYSVGILTPSPLGALDVAGAVLTRGQVSITSGGVGQQVYYAHGPVPGTPPARTTGLWQYVKSTTWSAAGTLTWLQLQAMKGTWSRAGTHTWGLLDTATWLQVQSL